MSVPSIPPPIAQLGARRFSFYPAILNIPHNEWIYSSASWSDAVIRNVQSNEEISVPRRYLGEISRVDAPVMIVGLLKELEYRSGVVLPAARRVIEMPRAMNESASRPRIQETRESPAPVLAIRVENESRSFGTKLVAGGIALGVVGCVLAVSLSRGGVLTNRALFSPDTHIHLPLTSTDDGAVVKSVLGAPVAERHGTDAEGTNYILLAYPQRDLYAILMGRDLNHARYIGSLDSNWRPVHSVTIPGRGGTYGILRRLPRF